MEAEVPTSDTEEQEYIDAKNAEYWTSDVEEQRKYLDALNADNWLHAINHVGRQTTQLLDAHARALSHQATSSLPASQAAPGPALDELDDISQRRSSPPLEFPSSPPHGHPPTTPSSNADPFALPLSAAPSYASPRSHSSQIWSRHSPLSPLSQRSQSPEPPRQISIEIPSPSPALQPRQPTPSLAFPPPAPSPPPPPEEPMGRYGLRQRNPQQINPYQFDRAKYKLQMARHPDAIVHRAELREKTPEESQEAGQEESQQDADADEEMQDVYPSPRKRRRSTGDDLPGEDVDRPRHRSGGGPSYRRTKSFRKHPRAFPLSSPSRSGASSRPPPASSLPPLSPPGSPQARWQPAAYDETFSSDDELGPMRSSRTAPRGFPLGNSPPRYASPALVMDDGDDGEQEEEEDGEDDRAARSGDVISISDCSSPVPRPGGDRSSSEDIEVSAPTRGKRISLHHSRPAPQTKQTTLAKIFTNPGYQSTHKHGVNIRVPNHTLRSTKSKPRPNARPKKTPKTVGSRRQEPLRTTHDDRQEHQISRRARNARGLAPMQVEVFAPQTRFAREKRPYATVDLEDIGIRRALAPLQLPTVNRAAAPAPTVSKPVSRVMMRTSSTRSLARTSSVRTFSRTPSIATSLILDAPEPRHADGAHILSSATRFLRAEEIKPPRAAFQLQDAFVQHGWLRELLSALDGAVPRPHRTEVLSQRLTVFASGREVGGAVQLVCGATDVSYDQLELAAHNAASYITWICNPARPDAVSDDDVKDLWEVVIECIDNMITRVVDSSEFGSSLNSRDVLGAYWIALELSLAFAPAISIRESRARAVFERMGALIMRLVVIGIDGVLQMLASGHEADAPNALSSLLLSLWVRALHICSKCGLPLSTFIGDAVAQAVGTIASLKRSELIWTLAYFTETLSRFNASGIYTSTSVLGPLWPLVKLALESIRLVWNAGADNEHSEEVLLNRDDHLRLVVRRCWFLHDRRDWPLDLDGLHVVEQLAVIFRSRKFANLLQESCTLPAFVSDRDPEALFRPDDNETAFITWLKLFAVGVCTCDRTPETKSYSRKLFAVLPVGSIHVDDPAAPTDKEMSMVCNRLAVGPALLAMQVKKPNPAAPRRSISNVHNLLKFDLCCEALRRTVLDAVTCMAFFEQRLDCSWDGLTKWGVTVISVLRQEWERDASSKEHLQCSSSERLLSRLLLDIEMLLVTARERGSGLVSFVQRHDPSGGDLAGRYLFEALELPLSLLCVQRVGDAIRQTIRAWITFCEQYLQILPPLAQKEESQDEYSAYNIVVPAEDLAKIDALNDESVKGEARKLIQAIASEVVPALHKIICEFSLDLGTPPSSAHLAWLTLWLESVAAAVKYHNRDWSIYMGNTVLSPSRIADEVWRAHVNNKLVKFSDNIV
ncbi:hypothetical protein PENSPDRAFT_760272 [Peniophora sp. CONT]|nr:hypothetical protein PENSPDRAFT_760272 [Peniophora sp. CONT]